ncbi:MAG: ribbon-helix-helix domain-containing protein [Sulfolobales archaeon]|nr:ribbon-helix-helix domain-containing protein [Sulfolobales archaeon]MDW8083304.1 ribbon-helix-helix domain-containing protein [Sulfolobales archaeon]
MNTDALVSVRLPENVVEYIDYLVRIGVINCRSDVLRLALLYKLKSLGYNVGAEKLEEFLARLRDLKGEVE